VVLGRAPRTLKRMVARNVRSGVGTVVTLAPPVPHVPAPETLEIEDCVVPAGGSTKQAEVGSPA
jgi:hypothetical protein